MTTLTKGLALVGALALLFVAAPSGAEGDCSAAHAETATALTPDLPAGSVVVADHHENPCGHKNPCNPCGHKNPCNPCGDKNPCNPCGDKNPCNPCGHKNPCNPCKPH